MTTDGTQPSSHLSAPAIPAGWSETSVERLVVKYFSGPSPDCEERQIASDAEWGVLKTTAITWSGWNETAHKVLPRNYWGRRNLEVQHGDVLVTKAGPRDRVGVVVHVKTHPMRLIVSGKMIGLRPRTDEVLPQVLAGVLGLRQPQDFIHARTTGMAESQVNFANKVLLDTKVRIPGMIEQSRIAAVLDAVDEAIAKTEAVIAKLKQVRAGLLQDLLTHGLDEHSQLRDPITHSGPFQETSRGTFPRDWGWLTLQAATHPEAPICYGIVQAFDYMEEGVPVLAIKDLGGDYHTGLHQTAARIDAAYSRSRVRPGDVLLSIKGTIGRVGVVPDYFMGNISRDLARLRPRDSVDSSFLRHLLLSPIGQRTLELARVGTTRAELSIGPLRLLSFPFPPLQEQQGIASILDAQDEALRVEETALAKLLELKSGLMADLLTGRIRVLEALA